MKTGRSPLIVIFTTVLVDLIGFGMVIPLIALYGRSFNVSGWELGLLGAIYSLAQFVFAPFWGTLSDRIGRRPVLLVSLVGSTVSYLGFALAESFWFLLMTRAFAGFFAANIAAAQAYIADVTTPEERAKGMGLLGAAFGIGFTLGPPLGGIAAHHFGQAAPGFIAAAICGSNALLAFFRLPESLPPERRGLSKMRLSPLDPAKLQQIFSHPRLAVYVPMLFFVTLAFAMLEQTFSLLIQDKFFPAKEEAAYRTGILLMWVGITGAIVQGGLIRKLLPRFGELPLLISGLALGALTFALMPVGPSYASYYALVIPMAVAQGLITPTLSSLISRNAPATEQGSVLGSAQGLSSLARAVGPFTGMVVYGLALWGPFVLAAAIYAALVWIGMRQYKRSS